MKLLNTMAMAILFSAAAATPSFADSADNEITVISPSVIQIGSVDPCDNGACDEEEVASTEEPGDRNGALIDAYGMPTSVPVVIRPTVINQTSSEKSAAPVEQAAPEAAPTPEVAAAPAAAPVEPTAAPAAGSIN
jgi:hypothetical protein